MLPLRAASGQGGRLDERTGYTVVTGTGVGTGQAPLLAIVLWRGSPGWMDSRNDADRAHTDSVFRYERFRAEERHLSFFGTGKAYGLASNDSRRLIIEDKEFALAPSDSALVIMVTIPDNGLPRLVTTSRISSALPVGFWPQQWQHGDTTFLVHPNFQRLNSILLEVLRTSPTVADYLR